MFTKAQNHATIASMGFKEWFFGTDHPTDAKPAKQFWNTAWIDPATLRILGSTTTDQSALQLPTFFRAVQILTDISGQLPMQAWRGGIHSDARSLADPEIVDPQPQLMTKPSPFHTRDQVIRYIVRSLVLRGNSYLWLTGHDSEGYPTIAVPINPDEVSVIWRDAQTGLRKQYMWREQEMTEGFDLLHIMMEPLFGSPYGLGPLDAASKTLGYALDADKFGGQFFAGSATPSGVLKHPGRLDEEEAMNLRSQWETQHASGRGTAILSGGLEYQAISLTPEQAQFIATRAFNNQQIATLLGVPQHLLNAGQPQGTASSLTYANLSMVMEELYRMTLSPVYLARIESAFQRILPRGQSVRFDTTDLLRTDDRSRWSAQTIALQAGIITVDEVRDLEGLPPLSPADKAMAESRLDNAPSDRSVSTGAGGGSDAGGI